MIERPEEYGAVRSDPLGIGPEGRAPVMGAQKRKRILECDWETLMKKISTLNAFALLKKRLCQLLGLLLMALTPLMACSQMKTITWKEEVKLTNGQVIVVERSEDYRQVYAGGGGPGWLFHYERIRTTLPAPNGEIAWDARLKPLALDVTADGSIYLVAVIAEAAGRKEYSLPDGINHVAFKYSGNNQWQRVPISTVPREFRPNLLASTQGLFIEQPSTAKFVDLALKATVDSDPRLASRYRKWPTQ